MSVHNLDRIFNPKAVAVVGASEKSGRIGATIFKNLIAGGFKGTLYPVNPKHRSIFEHKAYASLRDVPQACDLAVIATPIESVPAIVTDAARADVGGVVVISAGGKETGAKGRELERSLSLAIQGSNLRIIGPNCLGIINSRCGLNASFANHMPLPGKMAFISQSGAICTAVLDLSLKEKIGFSYFVSLGSMLDVDFGDMIDYIGGDYNVSSIVMYLESLNRFRNFMSAARAVSRVKPIVVLKAGRTAAGARAASSHTGALAGEDAVYDAAFKRAGLVRVRTFEELFDCAELLARRSGATGSRLAIVTNAGGLGVIAADSLAEYGLAPVTLEAETIRKLDTVLPSNWSRDNPIDILGDATAERFRLVVEICLQAPEIDALLILSAPQGVSDPTTMASALVDYLKDKPRPVFTSWVGGADMDKSRALFNQAGIATFDTPERAVRAFMDLYHYGQNNEMLQQIPPKLSVRLEYDRPKAQVLVQQALASEHVLLTENESKLVLAAYGIPVNPTHLAHSADEAVAMAQSIGFPVVLKIDSRDITHKTEAGGVFLGLDSAPAVAKAWHDIIANAESYRPNAEIAGVTVQPMLSGIDYELIAGAKKDRDFGPVILFGMGGIWTEVIKDRAIAFPPLNRLLARRLMEETKVFRLLSGYRNKLPANLALIEEILIRLAQLVTDYPEIQELDINPLVVSADRVVAADARIVIKKTDVKAPLHLVISPYPNQYEARLHLPTVGDLLIRPIRPEDAPLLETLFDALSPRSIYTRFFTPLKRLPSHMLARFTQIDYDREIALVAIQETVNDEKMLGVARYFLEHNQQQAEFSVIVGDPWQGLGIGAALLQRVLDIAKERGIQSIWGTVLSENTQMLKLSRKLGFVIKKIPDASEYEVRLNFSDNRKAFPGERPSPSQAV
jgi:acetyltransferase